MLVQPIQDELLSLHGKIYSSGQSHILLYRLISEISWQNDFVAFGRHFDVPRMQAWYADVGIHYRYSDNMLQSHEWIEPLLSVKENIEKLSGHTFNSVLVTYYRNGYDNVSWHADDEPELGDAPVIASLSLGASREFQYRHKRENDSGSMTLHDGELLIMQPAFQYDWEHSVPSEYDVLAPRINLTFRKVFMSREE